MSYTVNIIVDDSNASEKKSLDYYIQSIVSSIGSGVKCEIFPDNILSRGFACIKCNEQYKIVIASEGISNGLNDPNETEENEIQENFDTMSEHSIKIEPEEERMPEMVRLPKLMKVQNVFNGREAEYLLNDNTETNHSDTKSNDIKQKVKEEHGNRKRKKKDRICNGCDRIFSSFRTHAEHLCSDLNNFQCKHCSESYLSDTDLNEHLESWHKDKEVYQCEICNTSFINQYVLKTHLNSKKHARQCDYFQSNDVQSGSFQANSYLSSSFQSNIFKSNTVNSSLEMKPDISIVSKAGRKITKKFDDSLFFIDELSDQNSEVTNIFTTKNIPALKSKFKKRKEKPSKFSKMKQKSGRLCKSCGKKCYFRRTRLEHRCYFTDLRLWQCEYCDELFPGESTFFKHLMLEHRMHKGFCDVCNKKFYSKTGLEAHLKTQKHKRRCQQRYLCECQQGDPDIVCTCVSEIGHDGELPVEVSLDEDLTNDDGIDEDIDDDIGEFEILST